MPLSKILLVDDDENIRTVALLSLEDDYLVEVATSGLAALELAAKNKPDLILLDVMMPGLDGKATFEKLQQRAELADIPVVFMTAKVQTHEIDFYLKLGAAGVITKPFDPMTLATDVQKIWETLSV
ncbi:MAG: response regulator [Cyanobacteria bacterium REEB67]|nr:response regulator [Cyanobacteria bacterium REEB67]